MKTVKKRSQIQEKSVANNFNAKTVVASGALWGMKGDVRSDKFLIECKTTLKDFYPLTFATWDKIHNEAVRDEMRTPLMIVDLEDSVRFVVFDPKHFDTPVGVSLKRNHTPRKSIRVRKASDGRGAIYSFQITDNKVIYSLCYMLYLDFIDQFGGELKDGN